MTWLRDWYEALGKAYSDAIGRGRIQRCNCMVRWSRSDPMPAVKRGKQFFSPEGDELATPTSFEMMHHTQITRIMKERNEVYIGHIGRVWP